MRILPATLALSVVIHGAVIGWLIARDHAELHVFSWPPWPPPAQQAKAEPPPPPPPPEPPPLEIALLDDHTVVPELPLAELMKPIATPGIVKPGIAKIEHPEHPAHAEHEPAASAEHTEHAASAPHDASAPSSSPATTPAHGTSLLSMRPAPKAEVKGPSDDFVTKFLAKPVTAQPNPIENERVADDIAAAEHELHDESWMRHASPDQVRDARERLGDLKDAQAGEEIQRDGTGYKSTHETFTAKIDPDGTAHLKDTPNLQRHGLTATFDGTDALMRAVGQDPYSSAKLKYLDDTREQRYEIGRRYKHEQLARSAVLAKQQLDAMWTHTPALADRKEALFELWDDCAEPSDGESTDQIEGGRAARDMIVGFIRTRMTGANAFTTGELAALNARRRSSARFAPYEQ